MIFAAALSEASWATLSLVEVEPLLLGDDSVLRALRLCDVVLLGLELLLRGLGEVLLKATDGSGLGRSDAFALGGLRLANFDVAIGVVVKSCFLIEGCVVGTGALLLTRGFANLVDAVAEDGVLRDRSRVVVALTFFQFASEGITTFLAFLAIADNAHCNDAWNDEEEKEPNDATGDGNVEFFGVGIDITHDGDDNAD